MTELTPTLTIHISAAVGAVALGPVALWARLRTHQQPRLHRAFGFAWVTLMFITATSALFIHTGKIPHIAGWSPIHLLILLTYGSLFAAFWSLYKGNVRGHKITMLNLYFWACLVTGIFTLWPGRLMNRLIFG